MYQNFNQNVYKLYIFSSGFLLTYWTIKMKFIMAIMTMSLHGIGFSWVYATAISAAQACFPARLVLYS